MINFIVYSLLNVSFVALLAPFYISLIKRVKALTQRREGTPLLQSYYNILKLLKKEVVYSSNSSFIMRISPYVNIICLLVASLFVPIFFVPEPVAGIGNIILFLYILACAKFFMALGGLDAGSAFGGMGSSREMSISSILEPVVIIVFGSMAFVFRSTSFFDIFYQVAKTPLIDVNPSLLLLSISLFVVLIAESARIPVDNPETHLELTMIHEAMILEQSGRNLALLEMSSAIKQLLLMGVIINLFLPWGLSLSLTPVGLLVSFAAFFIKSSVLAVIVGIFESSTAKLRFFRLPNLFLIAFFLSLLTILIEVLS